MPHELKFEGSPAQPQVVPLTVQPGEVATVENLSSRALPFIEHLNASSQDSIGPGEAKSFVSSVHLVSTGTTSVRLSFNPVGEPVVKPAEAVEPERAPVVEPEPAAAPEAPEAVQSESLSINPVEAIADGVLTEIKDEFHALEEKVDHLIHPGEN